MAYCPAESMAGITPIGQVDPVARHPPFSLRRFADGVLGEGDFVYAPGAAGNFVGAAVSYDAALGTVSLVTTGTAQYLPIAASMVANTSPGSWSWYQATGLAALSSSGSLSVGDPVFTTATPGTLSNETSGGEQLGNMHWGAATGVSGLTYAAINPR